MRRTKQSVATIRGPGVVAVVLVVLVTVSHPQQKVPCVAKMIQLESRGY